MPKPFNSQHPQKDVATELNVMLCNHFSSFNPQHPQKDVATLYLEAA
ncbi:hypothetical protein [Acaryochloris marina]